MQRFTGSLFSLDSIAAKAANSCLIYLVQNEDLARKTFPGAEAFESWCGRLFDDRLK